ncbi:transposase [Lusitaniella coriacea LEGE 07157]|uniref:Transposase n=1 Tax=Lusitaniella coriacea LEGE 07157 TaxID=945747 RepID=A0A8J7E655_9CYAN|nr:transposase [Lusitaniella coriacea LEGE 07157]
MKYDPERHHRRSIRLKEYDYSQPGLYFVTLCTYRQQCWFGEIQQAQIHLNQIGKIVAGEWLRSAQIRPTLQLDEWIIMPNHLHGIVGIVATESDIVKQPKPHEFRRSPNSLSSFIAGFKGSVTRQINQIRENTAIPIWQRNYYESIIRDENALDKIRDYIRNNPHQWEKDPDNPQNLQQFQEELLELPF